MNNKNYYMFGLVFLFLVSIVNVSAYSDYQNYSTVFPNTFGAVNSRGPLVSPTINLQLDYVSKHPSDGATRCRLLNYTGLGTLATGSFSGVDCILNYNLTKDSRYIIDTDKSGASYTGYFVQNGDATWTSFPTNGTYFNIINGTNTGGTALNDQQKWTLFNFTVTVYVPQSLFNFTSPSESGTTKYLPNNYLLINVTTNINNFVNMTLYVYNSTSLYYENLTTANASFWNLTLPMTNDTYYYNLTARNTTNSSINSNTYVNYIRYSVLNITAYDVVTNATISNITVVSDGVTYNSAGNYLLFNVIQGYSYNLLFDMNGYALTNSSYIANASVTQFLNQSLFKTNSVSINIFDEASLVLLTNVTAGGFVNVTFISNLTSLSYNTTTGSLFVSNITEGFYEVKFNAPLYSQRSYYLTVTNRSTQTLNAYLSQSTINLLLTYVNKETGELIEGVGINVYKIINGSWTAIATGFTDITGRWQVAVATNTNYRFSSAITGYDDKTFNLNPVIFTSYTIQLTKQQPSSTQLDFSNINVYILNTTFTNNGSNSLSWQISAPSGNLESYGYRLYTQCKNISNFSGINAYGDIDAVTFNLSCATVNDFVTLYYNYTLSGGEVREFTYTYGITGNTTASSFLRNRDEHYGMGLFERILIVVLITIVFAGLVTKFSNILAGLGAGLFVMSYLSYIGFVEWWIIAPTLFVGFILITSWTDKR